MISSSDDSYIETKRLVLSKGKMLPEFSELAKWCESRWEDAHILNIIYEQNIVGRPRLEIIFEKPESIRHLKTEDSLNYCSSKTKLVIDTLKVIISRSSSIDYNIENMFVIGSSFERVAREEAVSKLSKASVEKIGRKVFPKDYWNSLILFGGVVFFVETEKQKVLAQSTNKAKICSELLAKKISKYDTFNYFSQKPLIPNIDSKENFDKNFNSSWFYYTR